MQDNTWDNFFSLSTFIALLGIILILAVIAYPDFEGTLSDISEPKGAISFAYEHMAVKDNITFIKMEPNLFEGYWERHYWVTDTEGVQYRLVWSKMHRDIKLNTSYTIHYMGGSPFNALWEYESSDR